MQQAICPPISALYSQLSTRKASYCLDLFLRIPASSLLGNSPNGNQQCDRIRACQSGIEYSRDPDQKPIRSSTL
ncbi:hypothetical protein I7I50_06234 [Histoplasma capsulatum G186AR]|uniref:Uncharacterized protein n=1 Tax=Ajellomyces capsulatus TaxID=5037 RepID=A0A8H7Z2R4_AJECA|nr:hypothetical protein I7I52_10693 [Histoplasma capsulatum]QSS67221.1 hypothetical protein I7I50_06234 [Histoplasma capsulatum G186AR]